MIGFSPRAQQLFAELAAELAEHTDGCLQFLMIYDPAADKLRQFHSFDDTAMLQRVLLSVVQHVRSGAHERERTSLGAKREPGKRQG